ncbi:cytochrome P450 [Microbulbifer rhizosphaerae]|uniref:Cytochrome P450 n=1 Tax=Microbulbifer rhizosphaerae TaxID=1562603 RepID=A0A7W4WB19_9GAMM|nr:cytochrome P450 [Microbulbifer rhizosphaerae]MBB3060291.1 cytochrome P450 [Microbulbifer rhizosphaerae]
MYNKLREEIAFDGVLGGGTAGSIKAPPPGPPRISWKNLSPFMNESMHLELSELADRYGDVFRLRIKGGDLVVLSGLKTVWGALVAQEGVFDDRADFEILKQAPQCHFVELKSGSFWKKHREIFVEVMHTYFSGRWSEVEGWLQDEAASLVQSITQKNGNPFDPNRCLALANLSFIQRTIFGRRCSEEDKQAFHENGVTLIPSGFMNATSLGRLSRMWRLIFYFFRKSSLEGFKNGINGLSGYIAKNVDEHRESYTPNVMRDMCDHLLHAGSELSAEERATFQLYDQDIVNGSLTQVAGAGTGVPTFALRWVLLYLVKHPDIQAELHREVDAVLCTAPMMSDRSKMPYMQAFLNEVLRHAPITPLPAVYYRTTRDTNVNGYFIEKNTPVMVNYYSIARDPSVWENPHAFDPGRFLDAEGKLRKDLQNKFFPFGLGARRCIGEHLGRMQMFLLCAHLVYHFKFSSPPEGSGHTKAIHGVFMVPESYRVVATPRN